MTSFPTRLAALGYIGLAAMHVNWARGSFWPFRDAEAASDQVTGRSGKSLPSAGSCLGVAGLLTAASCFVSGRPRRYPGLSRAGATGVVAVLSSRGLLGLAGRTDLLSPGSTSKAFRSRDRRIYSPTCLLLAVLSAPAALRSSIPSSKGRS